MKLKTIKEEIVRWAMDSKETSFSNRKIDLNNKTIDLLYEGGIASLTILNKEGKIIYKDDYNGADSLDNLSINLLMNDSIYYLR